MRNVKIIMAYRGTKYHGFQRQENAVSIQQVVEEALEKVLNEKITIYGCSRTDAGVHAEEYCFNFYTQKTVPCRGILLGTNQFLPDDISFLSVEDADLDFHARYSCKAKEYIYRIHASLSKDPFRKDLALHYRNPVNLPLMQEAASHFVGKRDFAAFCSDGGQKSNTVRTVYKCELIQNGSNIELHVKGDGFLYNMIRIIVGTLLYMNEGKISMEELEEIFASGDRTRAGRTARPHGLYLHKIYY